MGYVADKQRVIVAVPPGMGFCTAQRRHASASYFSELRHLLGGDTHTLDLQALSGGDCIDQCNW